MSMIRRFNWSVEKTLADARENGFLNNEDYFKINMILAKSSDYSSSLPDVFVSTKEETLLNMSRDVFATENFSNHFEYAPSSVYRKYGTSRLEMHDLVTTWNMYYNKVANKNFYFMALLPFEQEIVLKIAFSLLLGVESDEIFYKAKAANFIFKLIETPDFYYKDFGVTRDTLDSYVLANYDYYNTTPSYNEKGLFSNRAEYLYSVWVSALDILNFKKVDISEEEKENLIKFLTAKKKNLSSFKYWEKQKIISIEKKALETFNLRPMD